MAKIDFNLPTETLTSGDNIIYVGGATGAIRVGGGSAVSASTASGMIRWNGTNLQLSNGSTWLNVTTSSGSSGLSGDDAFAIAVALS
jgi:hypothetical protein